MSNPLPLDWRAIRPLRGTKNNAFEELCCQLARGEAPPAAKFTRNGTPDGGAECFAALADGTERIWQAKYFFELGSSQISQIKESIERALDTHPKLSRYTVCLPLDLPDARKESEQSARERWEAGVERWKAAATAKGLSVDFELWGSHELLERLARPGQAGREKFWWNATLLDQDWLDRRFEEARADAGPRYTPEVNVDLPIASKFDVFGRTAASFDRLKRLAKDAHRIYPPRAELSKLGQSAAGMSDEFSAAVGAAVAAIRGIEYDPPYPLRSETAESELGHACGLVEKLIDHVTEVRRITAAQAASGQPATSPLDARGFESVTSNLRRVRREAAKIQDEIKLARSTASASVAILAGPPGCGKTHLLCDIAAKRLAAGLPTILVMGQRMTSTADPWAQVLDSLDLKTTSADDFIAALEACAQAANARALILVDAINEGAGRKLWQPNLASFLIRATRSPWIGVVIGVRLSYLDAIVPQEVRKQAVVLEHHGFDGLEYEAAQRFFDHYAIEFPSAPLLSPEYSNPLFLKSLCEGLRGNGCNRVPKGHQGIRWVFDLYVTAAARKAAQTLLIDELVPKRLLRKFVAATAHGPRWMDADAFWQMADQALPGRTHSESLATVLISEGLFMKDVVQSPSSDNEVVMIAYDRLADHLQAEELLNGLDALGVEAALRPGGRLGFISAGEFTWHAGLIEALCVAIPERTGRELPTFLPDRHRELILHGGALLQSLIWRSPDSITNETFDLMLQSGAHPADGVFDVLLTLATVPDHPLNAKKLHTVLAGYEMPDRDAIWSTYLQRAYGEGGALDRLADWSPPAGAGAMDDDTAELFCITLTWLCTSSNRRLRDRATKSLVRALAQNLQAAECLHGLFASVDDPYVQERLHAALYGTAMIADKPEQVGRLAARVYEAAFAGGPPHVGILFRDYARGVIERSIALGNPAPSEPTKLRPPYTSTWPRIPDDSEIKPFLPDWSQESGYDGGSPLWSKNIIGSSIMSGDFGLYVIGTNSGRSDWLDVPIDAAPWRNARDRIASMIEAFNPGEKEAWAHYGSARRDSSLASMATWTIIEVIGDESGDKAATDAQSDAAVATAEDEALDALCERLGASRAGQLRALLAEEQCQPPYFDLKAIQRYVLKRVFDLGWTVERFGRFDRLAAARTDRSSHPNERIGKKYQWISLDEIQAHLSDHYQFIPWDNSRDAASAYNGPWQVLSLRDIDPSCTLDRVPGGTGYGPHEPSWWAPVQVEDWRDAGSAMEWVKKAEVPDVPRLLVVPDPQGTNWVNLSARYSWIRPEGRELEFADDERWEVWLHCDGFFVHQADAARFEVWAKGRHWGVRVPVAETVNDLFLGEFYWSPAWHDKIAPTAGWSRPPHDCPCDVLSTALTYAHSASGYDHSSDDSYSLSLPAAEIVKGLNLKWSGIAADFTDPHGQLAVQDPTARSHGPTSLLIRGDALRTLLDREKLALFWTVLGERRAFTGMHSRPADFGESRILGVYRLCDTRPVGSTQTVYRASGQKRDGEH
ncbi:MAG TPA: AVAST type 2 anti-phage system protein Avs2 [Terriglobales bacterium]|nr:AVAST type 2 anti-phage system protein Avs2 [Terriglobales bacterium]